MQRKINVRGKKKKTKGQKEIIEKMCINLNKIIIILSGEGKENAQRNFLLRLSGSFPRQLGVPNC